METYEYRLNREYQKNLRLNNFENNIVPLFEKIGYRVEKTTQCFKVYKPRGYEHVRYYPKSKKLAVGGNWFKNEGDEVFDFILQHLG